MQQLLVRRNGLVWIVEVIYRFGVVGVTVGECNGNSTQFIALGRCEIVGSTTHQRLVSECRRLTIRKKKKKKKKDSQLSLIANPDNMLALCSSCGSDNCTTVSFGQCTKYGSAGALDRVAGAIRRVRSGRW
jgi:hypothetical protein